MSFHQSDTNRYRYGRKSWLKQFVNVALASNTYGPSSFAKH